MKIPLFFAFFLLPGVHCTAQELVGPDRVLPGTLASFEIVPAQETSWHIVTPSSDTSTYQVDTGLSKLYFACPRSGHYTVIAGIVKDERPVLLVKTFINGEEDDIPIPTPPVTPLESWIKTQAPVLVKSKKIISEVERVAECFEQIVYRIDTGNIQTTENARAQLQITLTGTLALASPTAVTDWAPFLTELSRRLETELGGKISNLDEVNKILQVAGNAMRSLELPTKTSTLLQDIDNPNNRGQRTQNRVFRNLLTR